MEFSCGVEYERNSGLKFFSPLLAESHPVLAKNKAVKKFFNFLNFLHIFFRNFLSGVEYERNSGLKFFSPFLGQSDPVLTKNNAGKRFFNFFEFFAIFFEIFFSGSSMNGIRV